jgi:hypothetical protein
MDLKIYSLEKETHFFDSTADKVSRISPKLSLWLPSQVDMVNPLTLVMFLFFQSGWVDTLHKVGTVTVPLWSGWWLPYLPYLHNLLRYGSLSQLSSGHVIHWEEGGGGLCWYSFVLGSCYGFLLTFGFIMMTPQAGGFNLTTQSRLLCILRPGKRASKVFFRFKKF